ncbi:MAG: hypothetical protein E6713_11840 [Sporomusaceae bacterium]|nr:hypothetical protein [Sporomusaceae bacterium]
MNKASKPLKKIPNLNVALDETTNMKLNTLAEKSGESRSDVVRSLIKNGNVLVVTDGKKLITELNNLHNSINQKSLQISEDIAALHNMIMPLKETYNNSELRNCIRNVDAFLTCLQTNYQKEIFAINSTINKLINYKGY